MRHQERTGQITSLHDILQLVRGHASVTVSFGSNRLLRACEVPILGNLAARKSLLISSHVPQTNALNRIPLEMMRSSEHAVREVKARLRTAKTGTMLVIDTRMDGISGIVSVPKQIKFLDELMAVVGKWRGPSLWVCVEETLPPEVLSRLKSSSDYYLSVSSQLHHIQAQFLAGRDVINPSFFRPHELRITSDNMVLTPLAVLPAEDQRDSSVPAQAITLLQEKYRQVFESANDGIVIFSISGTYREVNKKACDILGYSSEELASLPLKALLLPESGYKARRALVLLKKKKKFVGEGSVVRRNGKRAEIGVSVSHLSDDLFIAILRDITESKRIDAQLKQSEELYRGLIDAEPIPRAVFVGSKLVLSNRSFLKYFNWLKPESTDTITLTDVLGRRNADFLKDIRSLQESPDVRVDVLKKEVAVAVPSKESLEFEISVARTTFRGKAGLQFAFVDIAGRKHLVRQLEESEGKYRHLIESSIDAVSLAQEEVFIFVNQGFLRMFGYESPEQVLGKPISMVAAGKDKKAILERSEKRRSGENVPALYEYVGLRKDGTRFDVEVQVAIMAMGGKPTAIAYHRDITERKKSEEDLRRKTRGLEIMREISLSVNQSIELDNVLQVGLHSSMKALDLELGGVYTVEKDGVTLTLSTQHRLPENVAEKLALQSMQEGITGYVVKTMEPLVLSVAEYPPFLPHKSLFVPAQIQTVVYIPLISKNALAAVMLLASTRSRPMGEHEKILLVSIGTQLGVAIENATLYSQLKESEGRYRTAVENISDVIYHAAPNGALTFLSPNIATLLGYRSEEFYQAGDLWRTLLHPDDRALYSQRISNQAGTANEFHLEYRMLPKGKAAYRWVRDSVRYSRNPEGAVTSITGILSDVTDRFALEEALVKSEEMKASVLESVREGVVVYDREFHYIDWNKAMKEITGIARERVVGKSGLGEFACLDVDYLRPLLQRALRGEAVSSDDRLLASAQGQEGRYIWARFSPLRDREGTIKGVVGIITDVTNRQRLERELRESEEILRKVIDGMGDALMISDLQGKVWEVNSEFTRITGYQRSEVLQMNFPYPWVLEEEMAKFVTWIAALREHSYLRDFDMTWKRKDESLVAISLNTTLLRNAMGEPVAMLNIGRDISDRKRLSLELERKNKQIELLNRIISKANTTSNFEEIFQVIGTEISNLIPYDQINVGLMTDDETGLIIYASASPSGKDLLIGEVVSLGRTVSQLAIRKRQAVVINNLVEHPDLGPDIASVQEGLQSQISIPIFLNERVIGTFNVASTQANAFSGEEPSYLQPIADQIGAMVDRVRLFRKVSEDSNYIHNLLNSIDSVVFTVDRNYRITEVNKAWREFALRQGLPRYQTESQVIGANLAEIVPMQDLWQTYQRVMPDLFERKTDFYSQEFDLRWDGGQKTYHIAINPMVINETVTGLVFTNTDITEIKRTEEEVIRRNKELLALNAIGASISKSLNLDEVLQVASEQVRDIVGADMVLFYLKDERKNALVLQNSFGLPDRFVSNIDRLDVTSSATGTVVTERQPLLIRNSLMTDSRVSPEGRKIFHSMGMQSLGVFPLQSKERVLGALDVAFQAPHEFNDKELQLLLLICNQLGSAIENAVLYAEVQNQVQRVTSLYELGKGLTGALDIKKMFEIVYGEVRKAIPLERFAYDAFTPAPPLLTPVFGIADGKQQFFESVPESAKTLLTEDSVLWNLVTQGISFLGSPPTGPCVGGSMLAVPVKSKQTVAGVISLQHAAEDTYQESHLRLLESIANLTEIAIDKAMLYEDTVAKSIEIESRNRELDDFTYVVSHDLKEPLISIEGYSKILLKDYQDKVDQEGKEFLGTVVQSSARMKNLIDDLLTLSRLGRVADELQIVPVGGMIKEILHDLQFMLRERNMVINVPEHLPEVRYNPTQLSMVFRNLISNAMKFNDKPNPVVTIDVQEQEGQFIFSVADNGIGIEEQYYDRIFTIFQRLQRSEEYRGTGAGLTIVKKIIERHRGRVWVNSIVGKGTTFYFSIPK